MKHLKRFNENTESNADIDDAISNFKNNKTTKEGWIDGFSLIMKRNPEKAIELIDERPEVLKGRRGMILKFACERGLISVIKHILDHHFDLVSDVIPYINPDPALTKKLEVDALIDSCVVYANTSDHIDNNKKKEVLELLNSYR
jgi:hypothetical protein